MNNRQRSFNTWFKQAQRDLKAARDSIAAGNYEWASFQSQQAAEKALKAYLYLKGIASVITHSIFELLQRCAEINANFEKVKDAKELDQYYIATRYPNAIQGQVPFEFFTEKDAQKCVAYAERIIQLVRKLARI